MIPGTLLLRGLRKNEPVPSGVFYRAISKPFFRKQTKTWYVQIGKQQRNLGPDEGTAKEKYGHLIAGSQPVNDKTTFVTIL